MATRVFVGLRAPALGVGLTVSESSGVGLMTGPREAPAEQPSGGSSRWRWLATTLASVAFAVAVAVAWFGGAIRAAGWGDSLVDTGVTPLLLPMARITMDAAAVVTVGFLVAAAFLVPGTPDRQALRTVENDSDRRLLISPVARWWVRGASWSAAVWALTAVATIALTLSDLLGLPLSEAFTVSGLIDLATQLETGRVLSTVAILAATVSVACRYLRTVTAAAGTALIAVVAVVPPAFAGHAASSDNHQLAISLLVLHIVGAVLWTGGLLALTLGWRRPVAALAASVARFSRLAVGCLAAVAASGVVISAIRLFDLRGVASTFGLLLLGKTLALVILGALGWWHRRRSIPALAAGSRLVFVRIAVVETVVMAATFGLAVALARTPSPETTITEYAVSPFTPVLDVLPEPLFLAATMLAVGGYLAGVQRLRDRDEPWPTARLAAWVVGWVLVLLATDVELALNSGPMFSLIQRAQHLTLVVAAPLLLVAGAPRTLALRALRPATEAGMRGPLEWLRLSSSGSVTRWASRPVTALTLYAASLAGVYLSAYDTMAVRQHAAHLIIFGVALVIGCFAVSLTRGAEPGSARFARSVTMSVLQLLVGLALVVWSPALTPSAMALALALPVVGLAIWLASARAGRAPAQANAAASS